MRTMHPNHQPSNATTRATRVFTLCALLALLPTGLQAVDRFWSGGTASYTNAANWTGSVVPGTNDTAINDNGTNNRVQINVGNPDWTIDGLQAGNAAGGAFEQDGQTVTVNNGVSLGVSSTGSGVYTLNGGTLGYSGTFDIGQLGEAVFNLGGGSISGDGTIAVNRGFSPGSVSVTATMDGGTNLGGFTWFEQGYVSPFPSAGVPAEGSTFVSETNASASYTMAADYTANNAVMIDGDVTSATITLTTPTACAALSLLGSASFGPETCSYTINHQDLSTQTGTLDVPDWYSQEGVAWNANGRTTANGAIFQNVNDVVPYLLGLDIALSNTVSPVTSIDLTYVSDNGVICFLALSSSTDGTTFTPVAITGYNQDMIVEQDAATVVSDSVTDVLNQTGGEITTSAEFWVGNFGNGVYNLSGGTNNVGSWTAIGRSGGNGTVNMTGGVWNKTGGGNLLVGSGFQAGPGTSPSGVLNHSGGTINVINGEFLVPESNPATGTYNMGGTAALNVDNWIAVGRNGGVGELNLTNGVITKTGNAGNHIVVGAGATGTINQYGGTISNTTSTFWMGEGADAFWFLNGGNAVLDVLHIAQAGGITAELYLNGGVLSANEITTGDIGSGSFLYLNGGTIRAGANSAAFLHDLTFAFMDFGGVTFDTAGYSVTVPQALSEFGGGGTLSKTGAGTLSLTGLNDYFGPNAVSGGTLLIGTDSLGGGNATIADDAGFGVIVQADEGQLYSDTVTLGTSGATTLNFDLGAFGNPGTAPLGCFDLVVNSTVTVNIADELPQVGQFPLVDYISRSGSGSFVVGALPDGVTANIVTNGVNTSIDLVITAVDIVQWDGQDGGDWDIGLTTNWINSGTLAPAYFSNGLPAIFNDDALGTTTVNITTDVEPSVVSVVNDTLAYTFTGAGKITGASALIKEGSGTLSVVNTGGNDYTGATRIQGGTVSVTNLANGGSPSAIGASSSSPDNLVVGGTLRYAGPATSIDRGYSVTGGEGAIETVGSLTLSGNTTAPSTNGFTKLGSATLTYTGAGTNVLSGVGSSGYGVEAGAVVFDGSSGSQVDAVNGTMRVASQSGGTAAMTVLSNAAVTVTGSPMNVGAAVGATGTLTVDDGGLLYKTGGGGGNALVIGRDGGQGSLNQVGGTIATTSEFWVGQNTNGVGSYVLSSGTLNLSNWFAVGRSWGTGTFEMSGGNINMDGGGFFNFVIGTGAGANDRPSVGTFNHTGGTITSTKEYWVAENTLGVGTNNISGTAVLNIGNWVSIGRGGLGVVNYSGGTFNKTGGGNFIVGDGGTGYFNHSGGATLSVNGELWVGQGGSTNGTYNLIDGIVDVNSYVVVGRFGGDGVLNMTTGSITKSGGGDFIIGTGGGSIAEFNQNGGSATANNVFRMGHNNAVGSYTINGGTLNANEIWVGNQSGTGTMTVSGGAVTNNTWFAVGREGADGVLNIESGSLTKNGGGNVTITHGFSDNSASGIVTQTGGIFTVGSGDTWIGEDWGTATWTMSGGVSTHNFAQVARFSTATGILNLDGGTFAANELAGGTGTSTLNFDGGTLVARQDNTNFLHDLTVANVETNGATIDTAGSDVVVAQALLDGGGGGGLTKNGAGALYLNGTNTYTGTTTVNDGTLGGTGVIAGPVSVGASATFSPGASVGTITLGNGLALAGDTLIELDKGLVQSNDVVNVTGSLNYGGTLTVANIGAVPLVAGDTFTVFPTGGTGSFTSINAPQGVVLDFTDGVVTVVSVPPTLDWVNLGGGVIQLSWPEGSTLVYQTNSLAVGYSTNWMAYPDTSNPINVTNDPTIPTTFFGLEPE